MTHWRKLPGCEMVISVALSLGGIRLTGFELELFAILRSPAEMCEGLSQKRQIQGQGHPSGKLQVVGRLEQSPPACWDCLCQVIILITRLTRYQKMRSQKPIQEKAHFGQVMTG